VLFGCGIYLMLSRNLQRVVLGFIIISNGVNLMVLTASGLPEGAAPPLLGVPDGGPRCRSPTRCRRRSS
jgi:multicomponent Na+:H+ antiporter subunit C